MKLHDLGVGVLNSFLCEVDPGQVHRYRLVCKKWKEVIDRLKPIQILLRFPTLLQQMEGESYMSLWTEFETANLQRNLYKFLLDANSRLLLDRIFICDIHFGFEHDEKEMQLLLPNSTQCILMDSKNSYRIVLASVLLDHEPKGTFVDHHHILISSNPSILWHNCDVNSLIPHFVFICVVQIGP